MAAACERISRGTVTLKFSILLFLLLTTYSASVKSLCKNWNRVRQYMRSLYRVIRNDCRGFNNLSPRSPDATPCDFFLWDYVKGQVCVPPLPASIPKLKVRIRTANETITVDMLQTVWNELDYRVEVVESQRVHI